MSDQWSFNQFYGYVTTWSAFKAFETASGTANINEFKEQLINAWKSPDSTQQISWPLALRVGRVD